jgi:hypothetical protein
MGYPTQFLADNRLRRGQVKMGTAKGKRVDVSLKLRRDAIRDCV